MRVCKHSLNKMTTFKSAYVDKLFIEYCRIVNEYIRLWCNVYPLPGKNCKAAAEDYLQVDSWLLGKVRKCAANAALRIIKANRASKTNTDFKANGKAYDRIKAKALGRKRDVRGILSLTKKEWFDKCKRPFRKRKTIPYFNGNVIDLNSDLVCIKPSKNAKSFDLWIHLSSIFPRIEEGELGSNNNNKPVKLTLPTKKHKRLNRFLNDGYKLRSSVQLRKTYKIKKGKVIAQYFVDLFVDKPELKITEADKAKAFEAIKRLHKNNNDVSEKHLGLDVGLKNLVTTSRGELLGEKLQTLLKKLHRRVRTMNKYTRTGKASIRYNKTLKEIKDYIGYVVNNLDLSGIDLVVMEDLKNITKDVAKERKLHKSMRKDLGHWNLNLLYTRIANKCEENRVFFALVEPKNTSRRCYSCGEIHKTSRKGKEYNCISCGYTDDADVNAARNILYKFLAGEFTVPS